MAKEKPRKRRKEARPSEILQAAVEELAECGFAGAKIDNIASRAGVAKGTVYLYYSTKEELFEAIVRDRISPVFGLITKMVKLWPGSSTSLLKKIIEKFYSEMVENEERRMILRTLISESSRFGELAAFYHAEILVGAKKMLRSIIKRGIKNGEFRDTPIAKDPRVIVGPAIFAAIWKMTFEDAEKLNTKQYMEAHLDLVIHALRKNCE